MFRGIGVGFNFVSSLTTLSLYHSSWTSGQWSRQPPRRSRKAGKGLASLWPRFQNTLELAFSLQVGQPAFRVSVGRIPKMIIHTAYGDIGIICCRFKLSSFALSLRRSFLHPTSILGRSRRYSFASTLHCYHKFPYSTSLVYIWTYHIVNVLKRV
jgi:hypothetical protein